MEQGEIWDSSTEELTDQVIAINERALMEKTSSESFVYRDAHPKHHGCVKAFFDVDSSALPPELRVGVYGADVSHHYPAWVRFSNGNPNGEDKSDLEKDVRGMAVKLMNVSGSHLGSQDLVMITSKEFFSVDAVDYAKLNQALMGGGISAAFYLGTHWRQTAILLKSQIQAANPLQLQYFSSVPYKLGPRSMKFKATPCASNNLVDQISRPTASVNFLRDRLVSSLQPSVTKDLCYEFWIQPNMDPEKNHIENPTIAWDEKISPYIRVATLTIPGQTEIDSAEHLNFCENLSFDPWHSISETRPMGQINRMRLKIYPVISEFRHKANHIPEIEPKSHDICTGDTTLLCQTPKKVIE